MSAFWRLPFPAILALRYLRSTRKDAFVTFLSAVAGVGIALGVAVLILALAALTGFQRVLVSEALSRTPQVEVELPPAADAGQAAQAAAAVAGVRSAQVVVRGQGWLLIQGEQVQAVELVGFTGELPPSFADPRPMGVETAQRRGLWVGSDVAARYGLEPGERLEVVSARPTLAPVGGPQPRVRSLVLVGTFEGAGSRGELSRAALPLVVAESLLAPVASRLEIDAGGFGRAPAVAAALSEVLPAGSRVVTWQQLNRPLFFVLRLEKAMTFVGVSLIVLVAALALVASLSLIIANKRPEIGMLGAMGATPAALRGAFLLLGGCLGGLGAAAGTLLGVAGAWALDRFRLLPVPEGVYFLDHVPFRVQGLDLAVVVGVTLALALAASLYAARRAAALVPVEALRR